MNKTTVMDKAVNDQTKIQRKVSHQKNLNNFLIRSQVGVSPDKSKLKSKTTNPRRSKNFRLQQESIDSNQNYGIKEPKRSQEGVCPGSRISSNQ